MPPPALEGKIKPTSHLLVESAVVEIAPDCPRILRKDQPRRDESVMIGAGEFVQARNAIGVARFLVC